MPKPNEPQTRRDVFPLFRGPLLPDAPRLGSLRDEIDRLFDLFAPLPGDGAVLAGPRGWTAPFPAMDLAEDGEGYRLSIELPGLAAEDVEVRLKDGLLTISGEKTEDHEEQDTDHHLRERRWGSFRRDLRLPTDVDPARIEASFTRGVLHLRLPKSPAARAAEKTIPVTGD